MNDSEYRGVATTIWNFLFVQRGHWIRAELTNQDSPLIQTTSFNSWIITVNMWRLCLLSSSTLSLVSPKVSSAKQSRDSSVAQNWKSRDCKPGSNLELEWRLRGLWQSRVYCWGWHDNPWIVKLTLWWWARGIRMSMSLNLTLRPANLWQPRNCTCCHCSMTCYCLCNGVRTLFSPIIHTPTFLLFNLRLKSSVKCES